MDFDPLGLDRIFYVSLSIPLKRQPKLMLWSCGQIDFETEIIMKMCPICISCLIRAIGKILPM